jgi:polysaccharide pyruvyl transferase WcaK-like protein
LYIRNHYHTKKQVRNKTVVIAGSVAYSESGVKQLCRYVESLSAAGFEIKVLVGAADFPSKDDQTFVNVLKTHCKAPWELITATSMEEWLDTINHGTFLLSGRFHHSIAAFCLNTPFIALNSNTHKVHAICAMLEQAEPLLFSDPQLFDHLMLRTNAILSNPNIDNEMKIDEICELAQRNFDGLKTLSK